MYVLYHVIFDVQLIVHVCLVYTAQAMGPQASGQPVNHTNNQVPTAQPVLQKRERKGIAIVNPETNKEIVVEPPFQASQVSITVSPSLASTSTAATGSVVNTSEVSIKIFDACRFQTKAIHQFSIKFPRLF